MEKQVGPTMHQPKFHPQVMHRNLAYKQATKEAPSSQTSQHTSRRYSSGPFCQFTVHIINQLTLTTPLTVIKIKGTMMAPQNDIIHHKVTLNTVKIKRSCKGSGQ